MRGARHGAAREWIETTLSALKSWESGLAESKGLRSMKIDETFDLIPRAFVSRYHETQSRRYMSDSDRTVSSRVADRLEGFADAAEAKLREMRGEPLAGPDVYADYCSWLE